MHLFAVVCAICSDFFVSHSTSGVLTSKGRRLEHFALMLLLYTVTLTWLQEKFDPEAPENSVCLGQGKDVVESGEDAVFAQDFKQVIETGANGFAGAGHADGMDQ